MDNEHYLSMSLDISNDQNYYERLESNPEKSNKLTYTRLLNKFKGHFTKKEDDYLRDFELKDSNFYGLPKVHKSPQINAKCKESNVQSLEFENVSDLKLRPIIAGPACLTHRLSNLPDILLRPFTNYVKSHLRDMLNFFNHLPKTVPGETILASFDVKSLYSNIPHDLGHDVVKYWLQKNPQALNNRFSKDFVLEGVDLIEKKKQYIYSNGNYYRQKKGTETG